MQRIRLTVFTLATTVTGEFLQPVRPRTEVWVSSSIHPPSAETNTNEHKFYAGDVKAMHDLGFDSIKLDGW